LPFIWQRQQRLKKENLDSEMYITLEVSKKEKQEKRRKKKRKELHNTFRTFLA
jgi:hypothetical protein